jgi:hypothetical protein
MGAPGYVEHTQVEEDRAVEQSLNTTRSSPFKDAAQLYTTNIVIVTPHEV